MYISVGREADPSDVEAAATLLFTRLKDCERITNADAAFLRGIFGPFPVSAATEACSTVARITEWLSDETLKQLDMNSASAERQTPQFGENLHFSALGDITSDDELPWLDIQSDELPSTSFDMKFTDIPADKPSGKKIAGVDAGWLRQQLVASYGGGEADMGMSITDLCSTLFDFLASNRADSELQNEVLLSIELIVSCKMRYYYHII